MEEAALPVTEVGPVEFSELRRLASIWRMVDRVAPRVRAALGWTRCAGHVQQLGSESLLPNLMEVKG